MAAIGDVARLAGRLEGHGVARALGPRATSPTRPAAGSRSAAAEIGYIASPDAASLVTGRTKNVGVVIPFVNRWFFGEVLEGIERALLAAGYDLTLYNLAAAGADRGRVFEFFLARKRVDAVIAVGVDLDDHEVARARPPREAARVPRRQRRRRGARLSIDDRAVGAARDRAPAAPRAHPHRAPRAAIGASDAPRQRAGPAPPRVPRGDGRGRAPPADAHVVETEMSMPGGYRAALQLLGHPRHRPTAVFAASDEMAFGAIRAAERLGLAVPARPLDRRRRRPRVRRDVRPHDGRAVAGRAGAARRRGRAAPARRGRAPTRCPTPAPRCRPGSWCARTTTAAAPR